MCYYEVASVPVVFSVWILEMLVKPMKLCCHNGDQAWAAVAGASSSSGGGGVVFAGSADGFVYVDH